MVQCPGCEDHFHPKCIGMTREEIERKGLENFKCTACDTFSMLFRPEKEDNGAVPAVVPEIVPPLEEDDAVNVPAVVPRNVPALEVNDNF